MFDKNINYFFCSMKKMSLENQLLNAKTIDEIKNIIYICDKIHNGETVNGYDQHDLPSDSLYEEYKKQLNDEIIYKNNNIMYMGSIPKENKFNDFTKILIMPKFDGCSVAMKFVVQDNKLILIRSHTRGKDVGEEHINTDITKKISMFFKNIYFDTNYNFKEISIRGEIVLIEKDKNVVPASVIAGKINANIDVFESFLPKMRIVGFEISMIDNKVPTQVESLKILKHIVYEDYYSHQFKFCDYEVYITEPKNDEYYKKIFDLMCERNKIPLDGFVYCDEKWMYPNDLKNTLNSKYGKYAWKPKTEVIVKIESIEYSMNRSGDLIPSITFTPIVIHEKLYVKAKSAISKIHEFISKGFGKGSNAILKLANDIIPQIIDVGESDERINFIEKCPWCNSNLILSDKHLYCENNDCKERRIQKYVYLLQNMDKMCDLEYYNEKGKHVKSKISEETLRKIFINEINIQLLIPRIKNLITSFQKLSIENQLYVLGQGGKQQIKKKIEKHKYTPEETMKMLLEL